MPAPRIPTRRPLPVLVLVLLGSVVLAAGGAPPAAAQPATVRGFVADSTDGQPLQGVNVIIEDAGGRRFGAATDADGLYVIPRVPPARYAFSASFIGYRTVRDTLTLAPDDRKLVNLQLVPGQELLDEVVVESERGGRTTGLTAGAWSARPADLEVLPTPDVSGDLASYLAAQPGVVSPGDQGGQVFIRGGEPTQNLVLLDGMLVYQPFHILGFFSAIPSTILSRADIYAGGFGSRYGGRLSSVIDASARYGNKRSYEGSVSVAPFVSAVQFEGPLMEPGNTSMLLSLRQSVVEQAAERVVAGSLPFQFGDGFAKVHSQVTENSQLSFSGLWSYDRGVIGERDVLPDEEVRWSNGAVGVRWLILPRGMPLLAEMLLSGSQLNSSFGQDDVPVRESLVRRLNVEAHVTYFAGDVDVDWGLFARTLEFDSELGGVFQAVDTRREFVTEAGLYVEPTWAVTPDLRVTAGARVHAFPSKGLTLLEPRFQALWDRGRHQWSAAGGVYHQEIVGLADRRDAAGVFTAWMASPFGEVPRAVHGILGYRYQPVDWMDLAAEAYGKRLTNLFVPEWTAYPRFTTRLQPAEGRVVGVDLRVEVRRPAFYGYATYGLSSVEYDAQQATLDLWYGTESVTYRPPHDRRHQFNVLGSTTLRGFDLSARWQYGSGLPFSRALGFDGFIVMDGAVDVFDEPGAERVIYERPFNGTLPAYHRLDVSVAHTFSLNTLGITLQATAINVYDRRNLFYLDVFTLRRVDQLPFIPSLGLEVTFR